VLEPSREALLEACAGGDEAALHQLYLSCSPQLFGLALGIVRRREQAEEILQDSFLLVWRHARSFDRERGTAMAWLARIVRNQCFDLLRRRGREVPLDPAMAESWADPAAGPEAAAADSEAARQLLGCLGQSAPVHPVGLLPGYDIRGSGGTAEGAAWHGEELG
jgi:RNA polymerase sigma-70 factor (ECF subfamily)